MTSVRARALAHLRSLSRHAAAVGATQIAACYAVVDQLPDPRCQNILIDRWGSQVTATAGWEADEAEPVVRVRVEELTGGLGLSYGTAEVTGGMLIDAVWLPTPDILISPSADEVVVRVPVVCDSIDGATAELVIRFAPQADTMPATLDVTVAIEAG